MEKQYFKVGDKVTCPVYGKGIVSSIDGNIDNPVKVIFENQMQVYYFFDGRFNKNSNRILRQGHIDIPEPELKEIVTFEKGEIVWGMAKNGEWWCVKFLEFDTYITSNMFTGYHPQKTDAPYNLDIFHDIRKYKDRPF